MKHTTNTNQKTESKNYSTNYSLRKFALATLILLSTVNLYAQTNDGTSIVPIVEKSNDIIATIENKNYEIVKIEFDIVSGEKSTFRTLQKGWTYNILAFGDNRVQDIDVEIYKLIGDDWTYISKDADASAKALVSVTPVSDGMYKIVVKGYKYYSGYSLCHYGLIIFHE